MLVALLSALALTSPADPVVWTPLGEEELGILDYRRLEAGTHDAAHRLVIRLKLAHPREWASGETIYELDCAARTLTMLGVTVFAADGTELRSAVFPENERRAEPIYAGAGFDASMHRDLCPGGPALDDPPSRPTPVPTPPS